jgi:hypothetical protein
MAYDVCGSAGNFKLSGITFETQAVANMQNFDGV